MVAPVCPISRDQAVSGMPGRTLPFVPRALDLPSLLRAVNALRDMVLGIYGPGTGMNNSVGAGYTAPLGQGSAAQDPGKMVAVKNNWEEIRRQEKRKRVYHTTSKKKVDKAIFVDVVRLNNILFSWEHNDVFRPEDLLEWAYDPAKSLIIDSRTGIVDTSSNDYIVGGKE